MKQRFDGHAVLITGAASGLGAATARQFAREGAGLILVDLHRDGLAALSEELTAQGAKVAAAAGSVAEETIAASAVAQAQEMFGRLDILINNAAIDPLDAGSVAETAIDVFDRIMAVNLRGAFLFARASLPVMIKQGGGAMVHTASISALRPTPNEAAYSVSKAALAHLSRAIALDHAKDAIRSNCVCPGFLEAVMRDRAGMLSEKDLIARTQSAAGIVPLGREGRYDEVAQAILYLASADASYVTGSTFVIDGGMTLA